jgi:Putative Actinobacterial Holin-X, holin superfamily III
MTEPPAPAQGDSVVALLGDVASDVSRLLHQEVELAKTEIRAEARKAAGAGRLLAGGAMALHLVAVIASVAAVLVVSEVLTELLPRWAELAPTIAAIGVAVLWLIIGVVLIRTGSRRLRGFSPVPHQTIKSLKEDLAWLRKPTA